MYACVFFLAMEGPSNPQQAASPLASPRHLKSRTAHERRSTSTMFKNEPMSPRKRRSMSSTPDFEPRPRTHRRSNYAGGRFRGDDKMKSEMGRGGGLGAGKSIPMAFVMGNVPRDSTTMKGEGANDDMTNGGASDTDATVLDDPNQTLLDHEGDGDVDLTTTSTSFDVKVKESFWNPPSVKSDHHHATAASVSMFGFATPSATSGTSSVSGHLTLPKSSTESTSFSISGVSHRQVGVTSRSSLVSFVFRWSFIESLEFLANP